MSADGIVGDALATPHERELEGRTALIAGGGLASDEGSIGFSLAWLYSAHGARVAVFDRDPEAAARTVDRITAVGGEAMAVIGQATEGADCAAAVAAVLDRWGALDVVASTVGRGDIDGVFGVDRDVWDALIEANLTSAWEIMRAAAPVMPPGSSIVTMSSGAAISRGPGMPYSVAKAGLEQLTAGAAASLAPRGIRVNAIRVGTIWSTFAARTFDEEARRQRAEAVLLGTEGTVWDIAAAAAFLSGDRARWITGQVVTVDGGGPAFRPTGQASPAR